jgi:hypothetical protein
MSTTSYPHLVRTAASLVSFLATAPLIAACAPDRANRQVLPLPAAAHAEAAQSDDEPCARKSCGDPCRRCLGRDETCDEEVGICNADGQCLPERPLCERPAAQPAALRGR